MARRRKRKLTIEQTKRLWQEGIPANPGTAQGRRIDAQLEHEFNPIYLAALREGRLTTEPPSEGREPSGEVAIVQDVANQRKH
jgi:hypothetical protein